MKVLHIAPHLGGGVGKAHASIGEFLPPDVEQTFLLLEEPRNRRYAAAIEASGARVEAASNLDQIAREAATADIVQFEFWNHPRLLECLARCPFPPMRSLFWSHISGLSRPLIQPGLMDAASRFVFTTTASLALPGLPHDKVTAINSGFGFPESAGRMRAKRERPAIAYLGTVDFVKMHQGFFDAIDRLDNADTRVAVWGADLSGAAKLRALSMQHPERIEFRGETTDPIAALLQADIFFYPLQPNHYGTSENALIEAMSLGLVPVVLNNPAELAIVRDGETGFVARSINECVFLLHKLIASPQLRERISRKAARHVAETRAPVRTARDFVSLWCAMLGEPTRVTDFRAVLGANPADWFVATQCLPGRAWQATAETEGRAAKGTLTHFESVFAGDPSLARLRRQVA